MLTEPLYGLLQMKTEADQAVSSVLSLEEQVVRLQALLEATRRVHSTVATDSVLMETARILVRELEMEGALFLSSATGERLASFGDAPEPPFTECSRFALMGRNGSAIAELLVRTGAGCSLSFYEQDFIEGLILQAAVALENAMLHERDLQWARVQQDLDAARVIQRSLLPRSMPSIPGYSLASRSVTCYEVGGDYLDTLALPDGSHLLMVADVAGKGLASAIVATSFRAAFRSLAGQDLTLTEVMRRLGNAHWEEGPEARRRYVTAILARVHPEEGRIVIVNAGHNPGLLVGPDGSVRMIEASGTPLGLLPSMSYSAEEMDFPAGSRLLLYTDGLTEVFCGDDEFGSDRLTELFRSISTDDSGDMLATLWQGLETFASGSPQTDDMTALAICHERVSSPGDVSA